MQFLHRLLFSIFIRDGKNVYRAPSRSTHTRSAPYVCGALHDVGWKHSGLTKNSRTPRYKNDYALRTSGTGSSGNGAPFQSSGNAAKWRQSGGSGWHYPVITTTDHQPNLLIILQVVVFTNPFT
nr:hypothetical protein [Escherichia coli]